MTEPEAPRPDVPVPARADARQVRGIEVAQGFGIGLAAAVVAVSATGALGALLGKALGGTGVPWIGGPALFLLPAVAYGLLLRRFARVGRRGWALGMALFAALAILLATACFAIVALSFR